MTKKDDLGSLSHVKEESPQGQDGEKSKVYLSQKPPAKAAWRRGSKRGKPEKLVEVGIFKHNFWEKLTIS